MLNAVIIYSSFEAHIFVSKFLSIDRQMHKPRHIFIYVSDIEVGAKKFSNWAISNHSCCKDCAEISCD